MPNTPLIGAPYPAYTATRDVPADLRALGEFVEGYTNLRFASASARDAAISTPVAGMVAYIGGGVWTGYDGSAWRTIAGETTAVATGASVFSPVSPHVRSEAISRTLLGGRLVFLQMVITLGADIAASTAGNVLGDPSIATITPGLRPLEDVVAVVGNGIGSGDVLITTAGAVNLRSFNSPGPTNGSNLRISATFLRV